MITYLWEAQQIHKALIARRHKLDITEHERAMINDLLRRLEVGIQNEEFRKY